MKIFCDSFMAAELLDRRHNHIIRTIETLCEPTSGLSNNFIRDNFIKSSYIDGKGKVCPKYYLTQDGFTMFVMECKTAKARKFKETYIKTCLSSKEPKKRLKLAKADILIILPCRWKRKGE